MTKNKKHTRKIIPKLCKIRQKCCQNGAKMVPKWALGLPEAQKKHEKSQSPLQEAFPQTGA